MIEKINLIKLSFHLVIKSDNTNKNKKLIHLDLASCAEWNYLYEKCHMTPKTQRKGTTISSHRSDPPPPMEDFKTPEKPKLTNETVLKGFKIITKKPVVVVKIPFDESPGPTLKDFSKRILPIIDTLLSNSWDFCIDPFALRIIESFSGDKNEMREEAFNMIKDKLIAFCTPLPQEFAAQQSSQEIGNTWLDVNTKIGRVSFLVEVLCIKIVRTRQIFEEACFQAFSNSIDIYRNLIALFLEDYNKLRDNNDIKNFTDAASFFSSSGLFETEFIPAYINSIIIYLEPIINQAYEKSFHEYLQIATQHARHEEILVESLFPSSVQKVNDAIYQLIFTSKLTDIIKSRLPNVIENQDTESVCTCAKLARSTNTITRFTSSMGTIFEREAVKILNQSQGRIQLLLNLHKSLILFCEKAFGFQSDKILRIAFERGYNSDPDLIARLFAYELNRTFLEKEIDSYELFDQYIDLFRLLNSKDVFETYYTQLLTRRMLAYKSHNMDAEKHFVRKLTDLCGPDYTRRMTELFQDKERSIAALKEFQQANKKTPPFFHPLVFSKLAWATLPELKTKLPKDIQKYSTKYENFFQQRFKMTLEWNAQLTRSTLEVKNLNTLKEIKCSGHYASIIMLFNEYSKIGLDAMADMLDIGVEDVEPALKILSGKKGDHLLLYDSDKNAYKINKHHTFDKSRMTLPFIFNQFKLDEEEKSKVTITQNHDQQIDAGIMKIVKAERTIDIDEIFAKLQYEMPFLEKEGFTRRINVLALKVYVKIEPSGKVYYLP